MKSKEFFYEPPTIEVIEVEVEKGFAITGSAPVSDDSVFVGLIL